MDNIQQLTYNHSNFERKKKTIMICDDEQDVLLLFGLVFGSKYRVIMVDTGEECIERYMEETNRGSKIHLILLHYKLGGMLGDSVARKIKEYNGTKIILNLLKRNKLLGKERISKFLKYAEHDLPSLENKIQNLTSDVIDLKWKKIDLNNTITL